MIRNNKYAFGEIAVGDAYKYFDVNVRNIITAAGMFARRHGWVLRTRKLGPTSALIWRVK